MPIHDWTRVGPGTWHDFHLAWIVELRNALNSGLLPPGYYAQGEQIEPDVVICPRPNPPPRTRIIAEAEASDCSLKRRTLVIRHASGDRIVSLLEIVSPANKAARYPIRLFVKQAVEALYHGYHLLVVDLFPPGPRDPNGIHGLIWDEIGSAPYELPPGAPLTLAAYSAGTVTQSYVEPTAVGRELIEMPLFLEPTYQRAYRGVPRRWQTVLERASP